MVLKYGLEIYPWISHLYILLISAVSHVFNYHVYIEQWYSNFDILANHVVQFSLVAQSCPTLQPHGRQHSRIPCPVPVTNSQSLLKLVSIKLVMPSNHLVLCCPLLLPPSIFPSIRVFSDELVLHIRWPKYWSFSFSISPSNEYSGLISFRMD